MTRDVGWGKTNPYVGALHRMLRNPYRVLRKAHPLAFRLENYENTTLFK